MKMMIRTLLIALAFVLVSDPAKAQLKIGYVSSDSLIMLMPQYDSAKKVIEAKRDDLGSQYDFMVNEYEKAKKKLDSDIKLGTFTPAVLQLRQAELQQKEQTIMGFQQAAQEDLQSMEVELMKPIIDAIKKAIEDVAKEKGYTYVLDNSTGTILYSTPSDNLMPAVKKKLGLKA